MANNTTTTANKFNLKNIMKTAWGFVKTYGISLRDALKKAWAIAKVKVAMKSGIAHFRFTKVDGTIREAWGTLKEGVVPATNGTRKASPSVVTYYDTEKAAWRCFKAVNIIAA